MKYEILEKRRPIGRFSLGPAGSWAASPHLFMIHNLVFVHSVTCRLSVYSLTHFIHSNKE